jgi:rhamnulokinase
MRVATVDLGATSIRVAVVDLLAEIPRVDVVHRWVHGPCRQLDGTDRWDWSGIVAAVEEGLERALATGPVASIGVDGWGVDYGLLDGSGRLLTSPFSYRDARTANWEEVADRYGRKDLYARTGIQLMPINTIFQLAAHDRGQLAQAEHILLMPDLLVHHLTGHIGVERSNAATTALIDWRTGDWDDELLALAGVQREQLPAVYPAGAMVGTWRGVPVHTVGSHDTASAFLGVPGIPGPSTATISSGSWVLVGAERDAPDVSVAARTANFSNEVGALGGVRFLTNVMGFWLLERCRAAWGDPPIDRLIDLAADVAEPVPPLALSQERFLTSQDVERDVRVASGLGVGAPQSHVVRVILESIASAASDSVHTLGQVTGQPRDGLFHVGGASRLPLFNELLSDRCGIPVVVGSPEATTLGNALVQGLALGLFADRYAARDWLERSSVQAVGLATGGSSRAGRDDRTSG